VSIIDKRILRYSNITLGTFMNITLLSLFVIPHAVKYTKKLAGYITNVRNVKKQKLNIIDIGTPKNDYEKYIYPRVRDLEVQGELNERRGLDERPPTPSPQVRYPNVGEEDEGEYEGETDDETDDETDAYDEYDAYHGYEKAPSFDNML
jgi:hypothetical protein